jgi:ribokinase
VDAARVSVTVVGSLNEDVLVRVPRLPGRGETVVGRQTVLAPGGKGANQAAAAGRLGGAVAMVGRVGDDPAADRQLTALADAGVDVTAVVRTAGVPTGSATIPVEDASGENLIVVVPGANAALRPADVDVAAVRGARVVLLQLEVPLETVRAAAALAPGTVVLTPAPPQPLPDGLLARVDVLVPNEHELLQLAGAPPGDRTPGELAQLARGLTGGTVVVTLGGRGALLVPDDGPAPVVSTGCTGAGDAFCGALAVALAAGSSAAEAVATAATAAALSTAGPGARGALPDAAALDAARSGLPAAVPVAEAVDRAAGRAQARPADDRGGPR